MGSELDLLTQILGSPHRIRVLLHLRMFGSGYTSVNEMAKLLKMSVATLVRTLHDLEKLGVAHYIQTGNSHLWRIREGWPYLLAEPVLNTIKNREDSRKLIKRLIVSLSFDKKIKKVILFGSFASGTPETGSDIDIFVLARNATERSLVDSDLDAIVKALHERFYLSVSILLKNEQSWRKVPKELRKNIEGGVILYDSEN